MNGPITLLDTATRDELSACVQLLARSVVHHRQSSGFVTLDQSSHLLLPIDGEQAGVPQSAPDREAMEEALEIVRMLAEVSAPQQEAGESERTDSRTQYRICLDMPVKILPEAAPRPVDALLKNISWGGAALQVDELPVEPGQKLLLILPRPQGGSISLQSRLLRSWADPETGRPVVSARFSNLSTRDEEKFEDILAHLAEQAGEDGAGHHARLTRRLDIEFDHLSELQGMLDDVATGAIGLTLPEPLTEGQSIQAIISMLDGAHSLKLRARVVRQESHKVQTQVIHRVNLKFEHPLDELRKRTADLARKLANTDQA